MACYLRRYAVLIAVMVVVTAAEGQSAKKSAGGAKKTAAAAPAKPVQPRLVPLDVYKCFACETKVRRRVAVLPVRVGELAAELSLSEGAVAEKVRDQIEQKLEEQSGLVVLSRAELAAVLGEQQLASSEAFNSELAPARGKMIPAQFLVVPSVDRVDVRVSSRRDTNNTAERYAREALDREREADRLERQADEEANEAVRPSTASAIMQGLCGLSGGFCAWDDYNCKQEAQRKQQQCLEDARRKQEEELQRQRENNQRQANDVRARANAARREAQRLRQQAEIEARQNVTETRSTVVDAVIVWKAIDTSTGAVLASSSNSGSSQFVEQKVSTESAYTSSSSSDAQKYTNVVNEALDRTVAQLAAAVNKRLATEPFRAKVVSVSAGGLTMNAGGNMGVSVGDTFGVRKKREVLTDPDTGLPLDEEGAAVGLVRVARVGAKTAFAEVLENAGRIDRGDELEWIGVFTLDGEPEPAQTGSLQ